MKILVYGAGVLGSFYAARLAESGQDVSILARGKRLAEIRDHGIVLESARRGIRTATRVRAVEKLAPDDVYTWVLVLMRRNQVASILPALAENNHTPNVLFMMNNASGPAEMIRALGCDRVVLGFPGAGGVREGHVIRYVAGRGGDGATATVGEPDGRVSSRLVELEGVFAQAGFSARLEPNMDAWLKTHVALISPLANALYMAGSDTHRLAGTRDALVLMLRAMREGLRVLRALDIPVRPPTVQILAGLPEPLLVVLLQRLLDSEIAEIAIEGHARAARDEMKQLADEFQALALSAGIPTPAMDCLYRFLDLTEPPVRQGSAGLPMDWRGVYALVGSLAALLALLNLRRLRRRR